MQYTEYDNSKRKIISEISTLGYGKRLYSNRYFTLMQILASLPSKDPVFLPKTTIDMDGNGLSAAEELDTILENVYDIHPDYTKFLAIRDSSCLSLFHMYVSEGEACIDNVSADGHKFDHVMDKVLEGASGFSAYSFRLGEVSFNHEKLRQYLEAGGLTVSRSRMNKLTPSKSTRSSPYV